MECCQVFWVYSFSIKHILSLVFCLSVDIMIIFHHLVQILFFWLFMACRCPNFYWRVCSHFLKCLFSFPRQFFSHCWELIMISCQQEDFYSAKGFGFCVRTLRGHCWWFQFFLYFLVCIWTFYFVLIGLIPAPCLSFAPSVSASKCTNQMVWLALHQFSTIWRQPISTTFMTLSTIFLQLEPFSQTQSDLT